MKTTSRFEIGTRACFQPNLRLVDAATGKTDAAIAAPCEITAVTYSASKVYYDISVIYVEEYQGKRSESRVPLSRIPSDMLAKAEA